MPARIGPAGEHRCTNSKLSGRTARCLRLPEDQQESVERIFAIGERKVRNIMTPRYEVEWIDADDDRDRVLHSICDCNHAWILSARSLTKPSG